MLPRDKAIPVREVRYKNLFRNKRPGRRNLKEREKQIVWISFFYPVFVLISIS
jgi:hypothetical protein